MDIDWKVYTIDNTSGGSMEWSSVSNPDDWHLVNGIYPNNYYRFKWGETESPNPKKEGIEMKGLYDVIGVYGEDRNNVVFIRPEKSFVIASSEEDAKMKSGIYGWIDEKWDADYLTVIVRKVGDVAVKEKPKEVKSV